MSDDTKRFLDALLRPPGGGISASDVLTIWTAPSEISIHVPALDPEAVAAEALDVLAAGENCYFGCALRAIAPIQVRAKHERRPLHELRGKRSECSALLGTWVDFDVLGAGHVARDLPETHDDVFELIAEMPLAPTLIVDSGGGLHAWWLFEAALRLETPEIRGLAEQLTEAVNTCARALGARRGWRVDKTGDLPRVLRMPGTRNFKLAGNPRDVKLLFDDGPRHTVEQLAQAFEPFVILDPAAAASDAVGVAPGTATASAAAGSALSDLDAIERLRDRMGALASPERRKLCKLVLEGKPFAEPGERDEKLQVIASVIAFLDPDTSPRVLAHVCVPSLDAMRRDHGAPTILDAIEKIGRAQDDARKSRAAKQAADDRIRAGLMRGARAAQAALAVPRSALSEKLEEPAAADVAALDALPSEYTTEELQRFCEQQRVDQEGFARRWVIQHGDSFYAYCSGRYLAPIRRSDLDVSLPRDLSPAPIVWHTYKADGNPRAKTVPELLRDYATVARSVVCDLSLRTTFYDERTQTLFEAACPPRPLAARFHAQIDEWIRLLFGEQAALGIAWLATVLRLDRQSCALYLSGPPGTGKTMLATGVSRIWTRGGFTELGRILDSWNADLLRCPLVVADEKLPTAWRAGSTSADIRQIVGSSTRTLTRKFMPNADLIGSLRVMLLANNDRMLAQIVGDEDLSPDDLAAVGERFLHIETQQAAADFLRAIGGRTATGGWVDGDQIAEHVLWLAQTVQVVPGDRFLVQGKSSSLHRRLAVQNKIPALCAEWIAKAICADRMPDGLVRKQLVRIGDGKILVNAGALESAWDLFVQSDKTPSRPRIGRALRTLAKRDGRNSPQKRPDATVRFHDINVDVICEFAEDNQIATGAYIRGKVEAILTDAGMPAAQLDS